MDSMQMFDVMAQRSEFQAQENNSSNNRVDRSQNGQQSDFKSFLQDVTSNKQERRRLEQELESRDISLERVQNMDIDSEDELQKLAEEIKEKINDLSEGDESALEELMALLAEIDLLLEDRIFEQLNNEENLEKLAELLEQLDIDLDFEIERLSELTSEEINQLLLEVASDKDKLADLIDLAESEFSELFAEEEKMLLELKELISELENEVVDFEFSGEVDEKLADLLAEVKELLSDLEGEIKTNQEQKLAERNDFFLRDMSQNQLLQQELKVVDESVNLEENSDLFDNNLLQQENINLLDQLTEGEIKALLAEENEVAEQLSDNLFDLNLSNAGAELSFNAENLIQAQNAANEVEFNQFFLSEQTIEQIGEELELMNITKGNNELTVELYPESLGKVDINISLEDGEMLARIVTESNEVRDLMKNNLNVLRDLLAQKNIGVENLEISVLSEEESLAQNNGGEAGGNNSFSDNENNQQTEFEFDLEELSEFLATKEIDISAKDALTSDDIDYVI